MGVRSVAAASRWISTSAGNPILPPKPTLCQPFQRLVGNLVTPAPARVRILSGGFWHGSGTLFLSGVAAESGDFTKTAELYKKGLDEMAAAVALAPDNVGVVIPRGATLLTASHTVPGDNGKELLRMGLADYEHVYQIQAPRFDKLPGHARGELLFGLAEGYARLGDAGQARQWFEKLAAVDDPENGHLGQARDYLKTGSLGGSVKCVGCHVGK